MKMKNEKIRVQLKNGQEIQGTVQSVDIKMNIHMAQVQMFQKGQSDKVEQTLETYSIRGSQIRHIQLPETCPIDVLL